MITWVTQFRLTSRATGPPNKLPVLRPCHSLRSSAAVIGCLIRSPWRTTPIEQVLASVPGIFREERNLPIWPKDFLILGLTLMSASNADCLCTASEALRSKCLSGQYFTWTAKALPTLTDRVNVPVRVRSMEG